MTVIRPGDRERLAVRSKNSIGSNPIVVMMLPRRKLPTAICPVDPPYAKSASSSRSLLEEFESAASADVVGTKKSRIQEASILENGRTWEKTS